LVGATLLTLLPALATTLLAFRNIQRLKSMRDEDRAALFVARAGGITSGLFALTILVESVPIFFYLRGC
jgi:hypothetical protein